jgi:hypothetical protein
MSESELAGIVEVTGTIIFLNHELLVLLLLLVEVVVVGRLLGDIVEDNAVSSLVVLGACT